MSKKKQKGQDLEGAARDALAENGSRPQPKLSDIAYVREVYALINGQKGVACMRESIMLGGYLGQRTVHQEARALAHAYFAAALDYLDGRRDDQLKRMAEEEAKQKAAANAEFALATWSKDKD